MTTIFVVFSEGLIVANYAFQTGFFSRSHTYILSKFAMPNNPLQAQQALAIVKFRGVPNGKAGRWWRKVKKEDDGIVCRLVAVDH